MNEHLQDFLIIHILEQGVLRETYKTLILPRVIGVKQNLQDFSQVSVLRETKLTGLSCFLD